MDTEEEKQKRVMRASAQVYSERLYRTLSDGEKQLVDSLEEEGYLIKDPNAIGRCGKFNPEK